MTMRWESPVSMSTRAWQDSISLKTLLGSRRDIRGGAYEIEMAMQDRMFDTNGQLYLPQQQPNHNHPFWSPAFEGDVATVNGAGLPVPDCGTAALPFSSFER